MGFLGKFKWSSVSPSTSARVIVCVKLHLLKSGRSRWPSRTGSLSPAGVSSLKHRAKAKLLSSSTLSCRSCRVAPCSWDLSMSEDSATCWAPTVPAAARCPALPLCLGTASTDGCSTQSTCWHTAAQRRPCCWRVTWVEAKTTNCVSVRVQLWRDLVKVVLCRGCLFCVSLSLQPSRLSLFIRLREKLGEACGKRGRVLQSRPCAPERGPGVPPGTGHRERHAGEGLFWLACPYMPLPTSAICLSMVFSEHLSNGPVPNNCDSQYYPGNYLNLHTTLKIAFL